MYLYLLYLLAKLACEKTCLLKMLSIFMKKGDEKMKIIIYTQEIMKKILLFYEKSYL